MDHSYSYYYDYSGMSEEQILEFMERFGFAFLGVFLVIALVVLAVAAVIYVLGSIGTYTIAKRRGIRNAWLAWIPIASYWTIGCISDQFQYVVKGKVKNKRKLLLLLGLANVVIGGALQGASRMLIFGGAEEAAVAGGAVSLVAAVLSFILGAATLVFYYMAMYDLYTSCSPQNNVLYLVLSIIFRVTEPFFVFFNRKKDDGMPPRREASQTYTNPEPAPQSSWEGPEQL